MKTVKPAVCVVKAITVVMAFLMPISLLNAGDDRSSSASHSAGSAAKHQIYFSLADEFGAPTEERMEQFDCSDKIYTVVELGKFPKGKHQVSVRWIDPHDETRENTRYQFHVHGEQTRIWAWLSLSRGVGAGMLQWIDPSAGLEDFIGPWTVHVMIDGKRLGGGKFEVSC